MDLDLAVRSSRHAYLDCTSHSRGICMIAEGHTSDRTQTCTRYILAAKARAVIHYCQVLALLQHGECHHCQQHITYAHDLPCRMQQPFAGLLSCLVPRAQIVPAVDPSDFSLDPAVVRIQQPADCQQAACSASTSYRT